jgi:hypothetical protein
VEWFIDDPRRGQTALSIIVLALAVAGIWLGRKRLLLSVPIAFLFLLLAAIAIPSAIPARLVSQRNACLSYLRAIQDAKTQWAKANDKSSEDMPTEADIFGTNDTGGILRHRHICPRGGIYTIGAVGHNPTCSYSNKGHRLQ